MLRERFDKAVLLGPKRIVVDAMRHSGGVACVHAQHELADLERGARKAAAGQTLRIPAENEKAAMRGKKGQESSCESSGGKRRWSVWRRLGGGKESMGGCIEIEVSNSPVRRDTGPEFTPSKS